MILSGYPANPLRRNSGGGTNRPALAGRTVDGLPDGSRERRRRLGAVGSPDTREVADLAGRRRASGVAPEWTAVVLPVAKETDRCRRCESVGPNVAGTSRVIIDARVAGWERTGSGSPYAITPDGERFLVSNAAETAQPITLIFKWPLKLAVR